MSNNRAFIPEFGGTVNLGKPGLAAGTNAGTVQLAAATIYAINGVSASKAITNNIALTAAPLQPDLTTCIYLLALDAAGALTSYQGIPQLNVDLAAGNKVLQFPDPSLRPVTVCPIGYMKIVTNGGTFTAGTTALNAAGVTATFVDLFQVPPAPLLS